MEVSRTGGPSRDRGFNRDVLARWQKAILVACCGAAVGLSGCQSSKLFSRSRNEAAAPKDDLAKILEEAKAATSRESTPTRPASGPMSVEQHLQAGNAVISGRDHSPGRLAEARGHFETVLTADPQNPVAHHRLGVIADLSQDYATAERHYAIALQRNPNDPQLLHDIGYSFLLQNKPAEAVSYFQEALTIAPAFEMAARKLADAQVRMRQYDLAAQSLRQVMPEPQVQEELERLKSAHNPAARPSLLGRVRENMRELRPESPPQLDPTEQFLNEFELAKAEELRARQQRTGPITPANHGGYGANNPWMGDRQQQEQIYNSQLANEIANVDRQAAPPMGRPLSIDSTNGGRPQYQPGPGQSTYPHGDGYSQAGMTAPQIAAGPMTGAQLPVRGAEQASFDHMLGGGNYGTADYAQIGYQSENAASDQRQTSDQNSPRSLAAQGANDFQYAEVIRGTQRGTAAPGQGAAFTQGAPFNQRQVAARSPMGGVPPTIRPAGNVDLSTEINRGSVDSAHYVEQTSTPSWTPLSLSGASASGTAPAGGTGSFGQPGQFSQQSHESQQQPPSTGPGFWGANGSSDDYRAAAAMGMGVGPGQMFPVLRQTEVASPGTNSTWNGSQFPQPGRYLPTDQPHADLSHAHQVAGDPSSGGVSMTPPPSSLGQQMPAQGQYWTRPNQFAAGPTFHQPNGPQTPQGPESNMAPQASTWGTQSSFRSMPSQPGVDPQIQSYDQVRAERDAHLNRIIQHVQAQTPTNAMASPSYGLPIDRPDAPAAQMNNWYPNGTGLPQNTRTVGVVTPEQYPSAPGYGQPVPSQNQTMTPQVMPNPMIQGGLPPVQYAPDVVVPPSYQAGRGQMPMINGTPSGYGNYNGGMTIAPGR